MADINMSAKAAAVHQADRQAHAAAEPVWDIIELLFFAYRDFVGDPDEALGPLGFGRAHHRVLHFVNRNPGMKVADCLVMLRISSRSATRATWCRRRARRTADSGFCT